MNVFDQSAKDWDKKAERTQFQQEILNKILEAASLTPDKIVLEYGCGTGNAAIAVAPQVQKLFGVDSSEGMLREAQIKADSSSLKNIEFIRTDLSSSEWQQEKVDFIYSSLTLHHIKDTEKLLSNLAAALKDGGAMALADLETEDGSFHPSHEQVEHFGFAPESLAGILKKYGLHDINYKTIAVRQRFNEDGTKRGDFPVFMLTAKK